MIPNGSITVSSRRVLLIENSPSDRQLLRTWLNAEMIETYEAIDIITAMAAFQKYSPNLILLQLRLPTWDGFEVIRRLKDDPRTRSVPVIIIAGSALTSEKAKGIDMGAVDFVSKPFDSVELLARVNSSLRTKALLDLLEQRAHLDGLTELANRFALQDELPLVFAACREKEAPVSILMLDIDHFKQVNDHYGHAAGDEVLRRIAMVLKESIRPVDFVARYGGEEFVVVCPECDRQAAQETAERIRQRVAEMAVGFRNSLIRLTTSVGVAGTDMPFDGRPHEILEKADHALYRAKASGRNAVWYWDFEQESSFERPPVGAPSPRVPTSTLAPRPTLTAQALAAHRASLAITRGTNPLLPLPDPPRPVETTPAVPEVPVIPPVQPWQTEPPTSSEDPSKSPAVHAIPRTPRDPRKPPPPPRRPATDPHPDITATTQPAGPPPPPPRRVSEPKLNTPFPSAAADALGL